MTLSTLDRRPPSLFKEETPAVVRLLLCSALAILLMVSDSRFKLTDPLRATLAGLLYPLQEAMLQPVRLVQTSGAYVRSLEAAQAAQAAAEQGLMAQTLRATQSDALLRENKRLRELLDLQARLSTEAHAAEVLYDTSDLFSRRITIDRGQLRGVLAGAPVMDAYGVLGQVTRVYPFSSEVALLVDAQMVIPVLNQRTGMRAIAYGDPELFDEGGLELRFVQNDADVQAGDLLSTSGIDAVYPVGLPVAEVVRVDRRSDSAFMRIHARLLAHLPGLRHVMVLAPLSRPAADVDNPAPADASSGAAPAS
jgi:rod shape-determining protein MreC